MTDYRDLSPKEQAEIDQQMEEDGVFDQLQVVEGFRCCICYQSYYNCLCSHEDD